MFQDNGSTQQFSTVKRRPRTFLTRSYLVERPQSNRSRTSAYLVYKYCWVQCASAFLKLIEPKFLSLRQLQLQRESFDFSPIASSVSTLSTQRSHWFNPLTSAGDFVFAVHGIFGVLVCHFLSDCDRAIVHLWPKNKKNNEVKSTVGPRKEGPRDRQN